MKPGEDFVQYPGTMHNEGVAAFGGSTEIQHSAIGRNAALNVLAQADQSASERTHTPRWDLGVITIIGVETNAVRAALGLQRKQIAGLNFDLGEVEIDGERPARVVATRALAQGQR